MPTYFKVGAAAKLLRGTCLRPMSGYAHFPASLLIQALIKEDVVVDGVMVVAQNSNKQKGVARWRFRSIKSLENLSLL